MTTQESSGSDGMPEHGASAQKDTRAGNYFVANYPPFSLWSADQVVALDQVLDRSPPAGLPLGVYLHIPFCRKRCDFCFFKVYTDKNASDIKRYLDALMTELDRVLSRPYLRGRAPSFVYVGGGTPSYLSARQLDVLFDSLHERFDLSRCEEITFECEPGTLQESKLETLARRGVTRLSLGVENFDADLLELNNRAHRAEEIYRAYRFARSVGFPQINIDLIAGMVGETDANWARNLDETLDLAPDSITTYQMEIPFNTTIYRRMHDGGSAVAPVADWDTKRRWLDEAFRRFEAEGYHVGSAYTASRGDARFVYRDSLWRGADLLPLGVSAFGHLGGMHLQNAHHFEAYLEAVESGRTPVLRAYELSDEERLRREFLLQLKLGHVESAPFVEKFGVDPAQHFAAELTEMRSEGLMLPDSGEGEVVLTRDGLLEIDVHLPRFFLPEHRVDRVT